MGKVYDCVVAYFDHAATTPVRATAIAEFTRCTELTGNPSSVHSAGQRARAILEDARDRVAAALGCNRSEVVFTSGGTESNNHAIKGMYWQRRQADPALDLIISAATEHHALIDPIEWLEKHQSARVHWLTVQQSGLFDLDELERVLEAERGRVSMISLMWANNETGVVNDIPRICEIAAKYGVPVHSDAVATVGHLAIDFASSGLTAMSVSGHKVGAPIGIGALIVARSAKPESLLHGGGQERGLRSGTMNFPLAAAFAAALAEATAELDDRELRLAGLRDHMQRELMKLAPNAVVTNAAAPRLPDNLHVIFPDLLGDTLLYTLDSEGVQVSTGSACQAGVVGPSHVVLNMGYPEQLAKGCIRISLGYTTSPADVDHFLRVFPAAYERAKKASTAGI